MDFNFTGANQVVLTQGKTYLVCVVCISTGLSNLETSAPLVDVRLHDTTVAATQYMSVMSYNKGWRDTTFGVGAVSLYLYQLFGVPASGYSVTYNGNGHTGGSPPLDSNSPYSNGASVIVLGQGTLTKSDSIFQGWATSSGGSVVYTSGSTFTITANITLYAVWSSIGGGSGNWNGGTISIPIELIQNFTVVNGEQDMQKLVYPDLDLGEPSIPNPPVGYMLKDSLGNFNRIFGVLIKNPANPGSSGSPAIGLTHHLILRGDFNARGMIDSKEGVFVAHGGPKLIGWGPEGSGKLPNAKRNPMLLIKNDGWPDNVAPDTWETRIMSPTGTYSWANFETNHLTTKGKVMCDDIVHTNAIGVRTSGATKIESYNSIMPHPNASTKNSGSTTQYWLNTYGGNVYGKQAFTFNCAREDSGKEVLPNFNTEEQALKFLTHETKKTVLHTTYSSTAEDEIICICGKSVKEPCTEHLDEWNDRYARNETKRLEAASFLVLEHSTNLVKLNEALETANEKIRLLEQKLESLEKVKAN
ncbi:MAG: InlB B-repeat-containing protein [Candidatus Bathyarchaeota archaeon]|nr:InlB B-repeat-containing protein [Candidatus Termiticorpusculum sp.]